MHLPKKRNKSGLYIFTYDVEENCVSYLPSVCGESLMFMKYNIKYLCRSVSWRHQWALHVSAETCGAGR